MCIRDRYKNASQDLIQLEIENKDKENMEYIKKQQYNESLEQKEVNKYILENKVDAVSYTHLHRYT